MRNQQGLSFWVYHFSESITGVASLSMHGRRADECFHLLKNQLQVVGCFGIRQYLGVLNPPSVDGLKRDENFLPVTNPSQKGRVGRLLKATLLGRIVKVAPAIE
ncbi:hypothetical protein TNIN_398921 [Trichonephila inaurata madagascariensis]|uniref:Uncharacterized protein n=1 Tax=Trichonephila inaurata madagascariensis TaxID=2747483 RepID=A0A8X6WM60_9ARAC|nr:hypothetical protein TNIN_398921 [Trichonephila inaurata madagascariensis]